ncbi:MAG: hypothetical protein IT203_01220 [Fimbriimonadaceae bacterium]|nr:hypothetical protein [Fimbriimonadaceae bacterium]
MVDGNLPLLKQNRPLRYLFLDLNAYFASVEQQEQPALRGRPIGVCPVMADTSFIIAASYEAKRFGVRTGTQIGEAKRLCPDIELVPARPPVYVAYHRRILEVCEAVLHIEEVCSIDEMRFRLMGEEKHPARAVELAKEIKAAIHEHVGDQMHCSVGIAPNPFLAKLATEIEKPNGLVVLESKDLPQKLFGLNLTDFTGINKRTALRLNAAGIFTAQDLCEAPLEKIRGGFNSIIGERWWYLLRGYEVPQEKHERKSLGHSHVLPPKMRTDEGCREVLLRLLQKASARLRANRLWASHMIVFVSCFKKNWSVRIALPPTQDTVTMNEYFLREWEKRSFELPRSVGVTFFDLSVAEQVTPSLFDSTQERSKFNDAIDLVNQKFGKNSVYLAGMERAKDSADEKIAFNKTWLFSEGKDDNEWEIDTFRGMPPPED